MTSEKLNTPLCYLVLSGSIVYSVLLYFFTIRGLLGYLLYVYSYSLLYHKASHYALSSDFVNVNKFEATRIMTGFSQQKDPSWCAVVVKP